MSNNSSAQENGKLTTHKMTADVEPISTPATQAVSSGRDQAENQVEQQQQQQQQQEVATSGGPHQALFDSIPQRGLKCDILFLVIKNRIKEEPEYVKRLRVIFQFNILKNNQLAAQWTCDTKNSLEGDVYRGPPRVGTKADCILTVDDDDWVKIMVGKLNPQRAFMMSKFKIKGNIMLLQKLYAIWFELRRKGKTPEIDLIQEIMVEEQLLPGLKSEAMAIEIVQRIVKSPHLVASIDANIQVNILKAGQLMTAYLIGMHPNQKPEFKRLFNGAQAAAAASSSSGDKNAQKRVAQKQPTTTNIVPDVIFTIEDDDLVLLIYGIYKVNEAIESGQLKVEGKRELIDRARALFEQPPIMAKL